MRCPYCENHIHFDYRDEPGRCIDFLTIYGPNVDDDIHDGYDAFYGGLCPSCHRPLVLHTRGAYRLYAQNENDVYPDLEYDKRAEVLDFVFPIPELGTPKRLPAEVPGEYANDYYEAAATLQVSAKASAALSRRLLQRLLHEKLNITKGDLSKEIDELLALKDMPSYIATRVDAVRNIGNFAAHPMKSQHTGEIVDVELGEAEWLLSILESLFDWYFVWPAVEEQRKQELNQKLQAHGKLPIK